MLDQPSYPTRTPVDFVIVGSGAAGGVLARELAQAGFEVVVLEQGPFMKAEDFEHDELGYLYHDAITGGMKHPQTFRASPDEEATVQQGPSPLIYARLVGGSSVHYTANFWRFRPVDFDEHSRLGDIPGASLADWPLTYEELEPYYTKVDWEIGVSGAPGPFDPPRSKPYPLPPLPVKSSGVLFEKGARAIGLTPQPAPMAILSRPYRGRPACVQCGFCSGYGCEVNAKSSSLAAMIPEALASGRCELRAECTVTQLVVGADGRLREVVYRDPDGVEQAQRAKVVILAANGAETARLLLMSTSARFPDGLANGSGLVGKHLMFNGSPSVFGRFEHPLNEYKGVQVTRLALDDYDSDPARGFYGGGGLDGRFFLGLPLFFAASGLPPDAPRWGAGYKAMLRDYYTRTMSVMGHTTSLPVETNSVSLDPTVKDTYDRPAIRVTYRDHDDDLAMMRYMAEKGKAVLEAAGATDVWARPVEPQTVGAHLLGTCRMGHDPARSVVDRYHRAHDVDNLFICDGSSLVTSGRGQPTMTIQALAFRAADHLAAFARRGEL